MPFRTDFKDFPFPNRGKIVWYFIIDWINKSEKGFYNVQGKKELVNTLRQIIDTKNQDNYELFGVWNGEYSTDIFKIPIELAYLELSKHFIT